jgi:hypothetical protein
MPHTLRLAPAAGSAAGYLALQWLGRTYGATREECRRALPGDHLIRHPMAVTTHAITIGVPPERIWPWLTQMGWHRGAWYTARWVDRLLFPANRPSADRILPESQHLQVGGRIPRLGCSSWMISAAEGRGSSSAAAAALARGGSPRRISLPSSQPTSSCPARCSKASRPEPNDRQPVSESDLRIALP